MQLKSSRIWLIVVACLAFAGVAALVGVLGDGDGKSSDVDFDAVQPPRSPLPAWPISDDSRPIAVGIDHGLTAEFGSGTAVELGPVADDLHVEGWHLTGNADHGRVVARGKFEDIPIQITWTFAAGNPQIQMAIQLQKVPASRLADDISLSVVLPDGTLHEVGPGGAGPVQLARPMVWRAAADGDPGLTFSNWTGDALIAAEPTTDEPTIDEPTGSAPAGEDSATKNSATKDSTTKMNLDIWRAARHPGFEHCNSRHNEPAHPDSDDAVDRAADAGASIDLEATLVITVGEVTSVVRWPFRRGRLAALLPVFDVVAHHPDVQLARAHAPDAQRWLRRARTLIYGHSNPDDPRYGNGGLLGHGLGGTVAVPPAFGEDPAIAAFGETLRDTPAGLVWRGPADQDSAAQKQPVFDDPSCRQLAALAASSAAGVVVDDSADPPTGVYLATGPATPPATVRPRRLDGRLESLTDDGLGSDRLEALASSHRVSAFSTPFVATRNPLIGAAKESLLAPERDGQWTVDPQLAGALTDVELWREAHPVDVVSVDGAAQHTALMRRVSWWWAQDSRLVVDNPTDQVVRGYTLGVAGSVQATIDGDQHGRRRTVESGVGRQATLMWWNLEPGRHQVELGNARGADQPRSPAGVRWTFDRQ